MANLTAGTEIFAGTATVTSRTQNGITRSGWPMSTDF
jgi:hypothetical protein